VSDSNSDGYLFSFSDRVLIPNKVDSQGTLDQPAFGLLEAVSTVSASVYPSSTFAKVTLMTGFQTIVTK
jgi:hypothetical protein